MKFRKSLVRVNHIGVLLDDVAVIERCILTCGTHWRTSWGRSFSWRISRNICNIDGAASKSDQCIRQNYFVIGS